MKKVLAAFILIIGVMGCGNNEIKNKDDIIKIENEKNYTHENIEKLVEVVKNKKNDKEMRKYAFTILIRNDYTEMRALLEAVLPGETAMKEELLKESLRLRNFKYLPEDKVAVLEMLLATGDKKQYPLFFNLYDNEEIKISSETVKEIEDAVFIKNDADFIKMNTLVMISGNYDLFKNLVYKKGFDILDAYAVKKIDWVEKLLKSDRDLFFKIKDEINKNNYDKYKRVVYFYLDDKASGMEVYAAEVIVSVEDQLEEKLLSDNYYIQLGAIKKYGMDESKAFLEKKLDNPNLNILRALSFLKSTKVFDVLKESYEKDKNLVHLEFIYLLDESKAIKYFKTEYQKLEAKDKIAILNMIKVYGPTETVNMAYALLADEKDSDIRISFIDFIIQNGPDFFIKKVSEFLESKKYTTEEKKYMKERLSDVAGDDTKDQILKSVENKIYSSKMNEEKDTVAFSAKLKIWQDYMKLFPDSFFSEEIEKKIKSYENYLEQIKEELLSTKTKQIKQIDASIADYKEQMQKESNMDKIKYYREKIATLEKERQNIEKLSKKSDKDKLSDMEKEYLDISEQANSISQQVYYMQNQSNNRVLEADVKAAKDTLQKMMTRRSELLEKIIIFYGYYIDKYGKENLNEDILRDINGINK